MNVGILGTGFGAYHAKLLKAMPTVERIAVFGRNETKLGEISEALGVQVTTSAEELLLDPGLDVIHICLPSSLHREYAVEALKHGKHVFCETPVCLELEDIAAMKQAEAAYGKRILVNQFIKFDPPYQYLYEVTQSRKYGNLLSLTLKRETAPLWGDLGLSKVTTNLMIHELDCLTWILGQEASPINVWGTGAGAPGQAMVRASFPYADGWAEVLCSSRMPDSYPFTVAYEAYFEHAKLVFHESDDENGVTHVVLTEYSSAGRKVLSLESVNPYEKSISYAHSCLQDGFASILSLEQAARAIEIAIKLREKLAQKFLY
ncbi:hypothetical protein GCM10010912_05420 [Paenibacillus albidus]|uniref:Gfo/Idh/MocA-like oxidoreductase N-terminal domain-containing protein n=2 Tax=Paenibacillus albidus TaxID=2041023 RepID=A0A917FAV0_9BACL|nr:hypothetical protein GCM10010912_05420 [Paenibacillus albidus]